MATHNGIIEDATGDLLRAGYVSFVPGVGESLRTDVPIPAKLKDNLDFDKFHRWNGSSWIEIDNNPEIVLDPGSEGRGIVMALTGNVAGGQSQPYIQVKSNDYVVASRFIFAGTDLVGKPAKLTILYLVEDSLQTGSIRLYDLTNGNIIAEKTGIDDEDFTILDMGLLSSLPQGNSVLEIQAKTISNGHYIRVSSLTMEF